MFVVMITLFLIGFVAVFTTHRKNQQEWANGLGPAMPRVDSLVDLSTYYVRDSYTGEFKRIEGNSGTGGGGGSVYTEKIRVDNGDGTYSLKYRDIYSIQQTYTGSGGSTETEK